MTTNQTLLQWFSSDTVRMKCIDPGPSVELHHRTIA